MKHKKLLLAGSVVSLVIFAVLIICAVIISKSTESRTVKSTSPESKSVKSTSTESRSVESTKPVKFNEAEFREALRQDFIKHGLEIPEDDIFFSEKAQNDLDNKVKQIFIKDDIEFLEKIRLASVENDTVPESIIDKINQRIQFLKDSVDLEWNIHVFSFERVASMVDFENDFRDADASDICKMINERIAGLRSDLVLSLSTFHLDFSKTGALDKVKTSAGKDIQWFYIPVEAIEPGVYFFLEGGSSILYKFKGNFPHTSHIEELSKYYNDLGLIPLKYDLCQPGRLAGLAGGWYEDHLWTQCWVDKKREKVIQANLISVGEPFFRTNEVLVVIFNSSSDNLNEALSYYDALHGPGGKKTEIDGRFFSFRPVNIKMSD